MSSKATNAPSRVTRIDLSNLMGSCRGCMAKAEDMSSIFDSAMDIASMIEHCTGALIRKEDNLPSKICKICQKNLLIAHKFKQTFLRADETLRKLLPSKLKVELKNELYSYEVKVEFEPETKNKVKKTENECDSDVEFVGETKEVAVDDDDDREWDADYTLEPVTTEKTDEQISLSENTAENIKTQLKSTKPVNQKPKVKKKPVKEPLKQAPKKPRKLFCEPCDMTFQNGAQHQKHKKENHEGVYVCEHCGRVFNNYSTHYSHVKRHLPPRYGCEHCDYKTVVKYDLLKHLRIHTGVKEYQCEYCTCSFYTISNLTGHIRRTHLKIKKHKCPKCERSYFDKNRLQLHLDAHDHIKRLTCDHCNSCFSRRCQWRKHLKQVHNVIIPTQKPGKKRKDHELSSEKTVTYISKEFLSVKPVEPIANTENDVKTDS